MTERDLIGWAIAIISNVSEGHWQDQTSEWQEAARNWLDAVHESEMPIDPESVIGI